MFLRQLTYLIALDQYRHFSRAAEHCNVSQPALSMAIRQLEHELGVSIVRRNRRVLGLTPEGERVLAWARQTMAVLDGLRQEADFAHEVAGGTLSIGTIPPAIQIMPLLMESLRAAVPALHIELRVSANTDILHDLAEQRLQMGLIYLDQVPEDGSFETHQLYAEQYVFVAGSQMELPSRKTFSWADAMRPNIRWAFWAIPCGPGRSWMNALRRPGSGPMSCWRPMRSNCCMWSCWPGVWRRSCPSRPCRISVVPPCRCRSAGLHHVLRRGLGWCG